MRLFLVSTLLLFGVTFSSQAYAESASAVYNGDGTATYAVEGNTGEIILQRMAYLGHLPIVDEHVLGVGETVTLPVDASTRCWEMYYDFGDDVDFIGSGGCVELGIGPITFFELKCSGAGDGTSTYEIAPQTPVDDAWTFSTQYMGYPAETQSFSPNDAFGVVGTLFSAESSTEPYLTALSAELKVFHGDTLVASGSITRAECGYTAPAPRGTIASCPSGRTWVDGTLTKKGYAYLDGLVQRWECIR